MMPLPIIVSCFRKIQIGFTFLVPAHPDSLQIGPLNACSSVLVQRTIIESHNARCVKTWRHPVYNYITVVRAGLSHGQRQHAQKNDCGICVYSCEQIQVVGLLKIIFRKVVSLKSRN